MAPPFRKPNHRLGGKEVRICGAFITEEVICTLPPRHGLVHATVAVMEDGSVVSVIRKKGDTRTEAWQLVGPPE